ncbi:hypothetical protein BC834DRAFT_74098 [Gloeopeniophorella convolvens]|nr:hypothetical protein BC834DRAFT_74098 [Gloeopeniophorella convolvens]
MDSVCRLVMLVLPPWTLEHWKCRYVLLSYFVTPRATALYYAPIRFFCDLSPSLPRGTICNHRCTRYTCQLQGTSGLTPTSLEEVEPWVISAGRSLREQRRDGASGLPKPATSWGQNTASLAWGHPRTQERGAEGAAAMRALREAHHGPRGPPQRRVHKNSCGSPKPRRAPVEPCARMRRLYMKGVLWVASILCCKSPCREKGYIQ